jgi:hypothetical protein
MRRVILTIAVFVVVGIAIACGDTNANPLIGQWRLDEQRSSPAASGVKLAGGNEVEFREDSAIGSGGVQKVVYEVESDRVIVNYPDQGRGQVIRVLDPDSIRMDLPMDEYVVYRRCSEENQLLGRWKIDTQASHTTAIVPFEPVELMEFRNGDMRIQLKNGENPNPVPVTYRVDCDVVTVTNPQVGESNRYRLIASDRAEGINEKRPSWKLYLQRVD